MSTVSPPQRPINWTASRRHPNRVSDLAPLRRPVCPRTLLLRVAERPTVDVSKPCHDFTVIALLFLIHADDLIGFLLRNEAAAVAVDSWICHVVFADDVSVLTLAM